jgi:transcriptional regulator with XRE-family HTH domain
LQKRRLDLGVSWKAVARQIGVDADSLTNWTKGRTQPDLRCLPLVIRFLGYDPRPAANSVGKALVRLREGQGVSQKRLAAMLRVDPSTLARWEREERVPGGGCLRRARMLLLSGGSKLFS